MFKYALNFYLIVLFWHTIFFMKVRVEQTLKSKLLSRVEQISGNVVLRSDIDDLSDYRQLSRALRSLVRESKLAKISFGIYAKIEISQCTGNLILKEAFDDVAKEALDRLGVKWTLTTAQKEYNDGRSTQVPAKPSVKLKSRCRRKFCFQNACLAFEDDLYAK